MVARLKDLYEELGTDSRWQRSLALRIAVAGCFIGHGILAWKASANFGSEWSAWVRMLFPASLEYRGSEIFLKTVAIIDIVDGLLLLLPRIPKSALLWVLFWGAMTAVSRLFFLGVYIAPYEINSMNALAEFLKRAPNWIMPLFLVAVTSPKLNERFKILANKHHWLNFAVGSQMLAILLHQIYEWNGPYFDFELLKVGMPPWFFGAVTAGAIMGLFLLILNYQSKLANKSFNFLLYIVPLTYVCAEGFVVFARNLPAGGLFAFVKFVSHFAMYFCMVLWVKNYLWQAQDKIGQS